MNSLVSILGANKPVIATATVSPFTGYKFEVADVSSNTAFVYNYATLKWDGNFNNSSISSSIMKYGTGSISFNNTQGQNNAGSSYLKIPPITASNVSNGLSITFWLNANSSNTAPYLFDFAKNASTGSNNMICHYIPNGSNGDLIFFPDITQSRTYIQVSNVIRFNQWQHIAFTINKSKLITIYVDAVSKYSSTYSIDPLLSTVYPKNNCIVGTTFYPNVGTVGNMDNFYIYNSVLTQSQITNIYNNVL